MTELEALRAVVEAARCIRRPVPGEEGMIVKRSSVAALTKIIAALDAIPAPQPAGETVEVRGVVKNDEGTIYIIDHSLADEYSGHVIATITARVAVPVVPVIAATVELGA